MTTPHATLLLGLEASAIAVAYAALGATATRRPLRLFGVVAAAHALIVALAWAAAGGPGDAGALARVRLLFAGEALAAWGLGAAVARLRVDRGVAAAIAALVMLGLAFAPAPGEAVGKGARARTAAHAASPPFVASALLGLDVLHDPALYGRVPAAVMEMHMTPWIWTAGAYLATGSLLALLAFGRRGDRLRGRTLGVAAVLLAVVVALGAGGCKKDEKKPDDKPKGGDPKGKPDPKGSGTASGQPDEPDEPATPVTRAPSADELRKAIDRGVEFLAKGRSTDGLIGGHPGTTALASLAIASADGVAKDDARLAPSLDALAKLAKPDGAIFDKDYPVYVTAISVLAFQRAGVHAELIGKGQQWLADKQFADGNGTSPGDVNFGGIGYGTDATHPDADLSNLHFALDALKDSTLKDRPDVMARAQKFLERCQNRSESNDQTWASNDGGFVYKPGVSKAGATTSSGSMTYAGVAAFLYADVDGKDPRVAAALAWLESNYSVDENPGLGSKGLYYHFHMMGRALGLLGERNVADADGQQHDWPAELGAKLLSMQKPDGSWANADATYWEDNPAIATARAVLALEYALAAMK